MVQQTMNSPWIDVSVSLYDGMVHWPEDPPVRLERLLDMAKGDPCNLTQISSCLHVGTHVDAPLHYVPGGRSLEAMPLELAIAPVRVIEVCDSASVGPEQLRSKCVRRGEPLLIKTSNSVHCWSQSSFCEEFVSLSPQGASFLVECQVPVVGIDYLSIGALGEPGEQTHRLLLGSGIWVIEGLNLSQVSAGYYDMICLPLKLQGAEGGPARVVLRARG